MIAIYAMLGAHIVILPVEGIVTGSSVSAIQKLDPTLMETRS